MTYGLPDSVIIGTGKRITATVRKAPHRNPNSIADDLIFDGAVALDDFFFGWIRRLVARPKRETYQAPKNMRFTAKQVRKQQKRFGL